jgi:hypothetical protein
MGYSKSSRKGSYSHQDVHQKKQRSWECSSVVECRLSICKVLGSIPSTKTKQKAERSPMNDLLHLMELEKQGQTKLKIHRRKDTNIRAQIEIYKKMRRPIK